MVEVEVKVEKIVEVPVEVIKYIEVEKVVEKIVYKPIEEMPPGQEQTQDKKSDLNSICSIGQDEDEDGFEIDSLDVDL